MSARAGDPARPATAALRDAVVVVLVVACAALARWAPEVTLLGTLPDEEYYQRAFRAAANGESPFVPGYFYPYPVALLGGWAFRRFGEHATFVTLRVLECFGAALVIEAALRWLALRLAPRLALALAIFAVAPSVKHALDFGNLGALAAGLGLCGLATIERRPVLGGALFGLSLACKPMLVVAALALTLHGLLRDRRLARAMAIAALVSLAPLAVRPSLIPGMLGVGDAPESSSMMSLYRALHLFGVPLPPLAVTALVAATTLLLVARAPREIREVIAIGCVASVLSLPYVWKHTLLLVLPVQALAVAGALGALRRAKAPEPRQRALLGLVLVVLAITLLFTAEALPFLRAMNAPAAVMGALVVGYNALLVALLRVALRSDAIRGAGAPQPVVSRPGSGPLQ